MTSLKEKNKKTIFITVINDLISEQRMHKTALTLMDEGFIPVLIGTVGNNKTRLKNRPYFTHRMNTLFKKGPFFYLDYNFRLIIYMLLHNPNFVLNVDLDTALSGFVYKKITKTPQIIDNHEYFPEVPELVNRPFKKKKWEQLQDAIYPSADQLYTVCESIAKIFSNRYECQVPVVRNVPFKAVSNNIKPAKINIPTDRPIILYQGAVNQGRGIEEAILAMHKIDSALLVVVGGGDLLEKMKELIDNEKLNDRVTLTGKLPFDQLPSITRLATIGLSIEKDLGLNYRFALPNKLFDYIHCNVPVLVNDLPEMAKIVDEFKVGQKLEMHSSEQIALQINDMLRSKERLMEWKQNCKNAANELFWEKEDRIIRNIFNSFS